MNKSKRETGYYWVKWHGKWVIAVYDYFDDWWIHGIPYFLHTSEFEEIDEKRIEREGGV